MSEKESIIIKIRKLMERASKTNFEAEAQSSMLMAQKLMIKNGLSMAEVELTEKETKKEVLDESISITKTRQAWKESLAMIIAKNFRCEIYIRKSRKEMYTTKKGEYRYSRVVQLVGLKEDVEIAQEVFKYAVISVENLWKNYLEERKRAVGRDIPVTESFTMWKSYVGGFLRGLSDKFDEQVKTEGWGLVLVKDALVIKKMEDLHLKKGTASRANLSGDADASYRGYKDGKNFNADKKQEEPKQIKR